MEKRAHADRCHELPPELPDDMDLMIEVRFSLYFVRHRYPRYPFFLNNWAQAKDKEQAVFHLYRIYNLHTVNQKNLRPEKPPKPFERSPKKTKKAKAVKDGKDGEGLMGDEEGVANEGADAEAESPKKRKTRARKVKGRICIVQSGMVLTPP